MQLMRYISKVKPEEHLGECLSHANTQQRLKLLLIVVSAPTSRKLVTCFPWGQLTPIVKNHRSPTSKDRSLQTPPPPAPPPSAASLTGKRWKTHRGTKHESSPGKPPLKEAEPFPHSARGTLPPSHAPVEDHRCWGTRMPLNSKAAPTFETTSTEPEG